MAIVESVPLSAVIDQLRGRLSNAEIDALVFAVTVQRRDLVSPGDLITADMMNQILRDIEDIELRLGRLEAGSGGDTVLRAPIIERIEPSTVRTGQRMTVRGRNLTPSLLNHIEVEDSDVPLNRLDPASNATQLIFDAPVVTSIATTGSTVILAVTNPAGRGTGTFFLLPETASGLTANFTIALSSITPAAATTATTDYEYAFEIVGRVSREATFTVTPTLTPTTGATGWSAVMADDSREITMPESLTSAARRTVIVRVHSGASGGATLSLTVRSREVPAISSTSGTQTINIGTPPDVPSPDIVFGTPVRVGATNIRIANGAVYFAGAENNVARSIRIPLTLNLNGRYTIGPAVASNANWRARVTVPASPVLVSDTAHNFEIRVELTYLGTFNTGNPTEHDGTLTVPVSGDGTLPDSNFRIALKARSDPANPVPA